MPIAPPPTSTLPHTVMPIIGRLIIGLVVALLAGEVAAQDSSRGGGFVALVNGEAITTYELEQKVEQRLRSLGSRYSEEMLQGRVREQQRGIVLEELITERLLLQRCAREKIEVRPEEVDAWIQMRLEDLRRRDDSIRTVGDLFDRWEVDFGENEEQARAQIRTQMRISRLLDTKIYKQEYISPAELRAYYRAHPEEFSTPTVHVFRQILIAHDDPDVDEILAAIREDHEEGRDFAEMVAEYSRGPRAAEGGLYELTDEQLDAWWPPVPERVRALPIGAMSEPLRAASRIHVIEIVEHQVGRRKEFAECQAEIRSKLREQREALQRERFEEELRRNAEIRRFIDAP